MALDKTFLEERRQHLLKLIARYERLSRGEEASDGFTPEARRFRIECSLPAARAALERLESGEYGVCIICGDDIPIERLMATSTAVRCVFCQERHERETPVLSPERWTPAWTQE